jgi:putative hydrolase of the HAD superfamily
VLGFRIDPAHALLADDMAQNLAPAKALGMTTVWVDNGSERGNHGYDDSVIDEPVPDLGDWLEAVLGEQG